MYGIYSKENLYLYFWIKGVMKKFDGNCRFIEKCLDFFNIQIEFFFCVKDNLENEIFVDKRKM